MIATDKLGFGERVCAHVGCGKTFLIKAGSIGMYLYKLESRKGLDYYCCYSHYKINKEAHEEKVKKSVKAGRYNKKVGVQ